MRGDVIRAFFVATLCAVIVRLGTCDDVISIVEEEAVCESQQKYTVSCPKDYMVIIRGATLKRSRQPGCHVTSQDTCTVQDRRYSLLSQCYFKQTCDFDIEVNVTSPFEDCSGFEGDLFMELSYRCEEPILFAHEDNYRLMCNMSEMWRGSHLFLSNNGYPHFKNQDGCVCAVQVARHIQLEVTLLHFDAEHERDGECHQRFVIESNDASHEVCSESHDLDPRPLNMTYLEDAFWKIENNADESFRFLLVLQVHHDESFTVSCGDNLVDHVFSADQKRESVETTTSSSIVTAKTSDVGRLTTSQVNVGLQQEALTSKTTSQIHWPVITGVVAFVCVVLVAAVAFLVFCRRSSKRKQSPKKQHAFENPQYENTTVEVCMPTVVTLKPVNINETKEERDVTSNKPTEQKEALSLQVETSLPVIEHVREKSHVNKESHVDLKRKSDVNDDVASDFPGIPVAVLRRLRGESETTVVVEQTTQAGNQISLAPEEAPVSALSTPATSVNDLTDAAHLLKNQQKPARQSRDRNTRL